jgi:hypothetical protein
MRFYNNFIGSASVNTETEFSMCDVRELYEKNLLEQPEDWYYRTAKITYKNNAYGHRCKNISEIDLDNYILFSGCSHTQGEGLELEKTYPYLVSTALNTDYYNLGLAGTGIDVMEFNLISWFKSIIKKPKLVVIQWTDHTRYSALFPGYTEFMQNGSWTKNANAKRFLYSAEESGLFNARKLITRKLLLEIIDVPVYEIQFNNHSMYSNDGIWLKKIDFARDVSRTDFGVTGHAGIISHQNTADQLLAVIRNNDK